MGYVNIQEDSFQVGATSGLQLYASLAFPLILLTMLIYGIMEVAKRRSIRKKAVAQQASRV